MSSAGSGEKSVLYGWGCGTVYSVGSTPVWSCWVKINFMRSRWGSKTRPPVHILTDTHTHSGCCWRLASYSWFPPVCAGGVGLSWAVSGDAALTLVNRRTASGEGTCRRWAWYRHSVLAMITDRILILSLLSPKTDPCLSKHSSPRKSYFSVRAYLLISMSNVFLFFNEHIISRNILFLFVDYFMAWQHVQSIVVTNAARPY